MINLFVSSLLRFHFLSLYGNSTLIVRKLLLVLSNFDL